MSQQQPQPGPQWGQQPQGPGGPGYGPQPPDPGQPYQPPVPPKKASAGKKVGLGCLGVLGFVVVMGIAAAATSSSQHSTPSAAPSSSIAAPAQAAPAKTSTASTPGAAIYAWYIGGGKDKLDALQHDMQSIGTDGQNQDSAQMSADCTTLAGDVTSAQGYGPVPDGTAQQHWSATLTDLGNGAADCTAGAAAQDAVQLTKGSGEISAANAEMTKVSDRLTQIKNG